MIANRPDSHRIGPALKLLVGSGDKIALFTMPFVVVGLLLNLLFPAAFSVGGPPAPLLVISIVALVPGLIMWAWSVALILTRVPRGELITSGPFALVRHPIYTGVALLVLPWVGFLCNSWLGAVIGIVLYIGTRIFAPEEEAALARTFGASWEEYRARVLIPWM